VIQAIFRPAKRGREGALEPTCNEHIKFTTSRHVVAAAERQGKTHLKLDDGAERTFDHVLLGTGHKIDIVRYGLLSTDLLERVRTQTDIQYSTQDLNLRRPACTSLEPQRPNRSVLFMRFVAGKHYAAEVPSRHVVRAQTKHVTRSYAERPAAVDAS